MALLESQQGKPVPFCNNWRFYKILGHNLAVCSNRERGKTRFAPLYIHSFQFLRPRRLKDAEKFNVLYDSGEKQSIADKLQYYRYKKSLLQREVAEKAEIGRGTYESYESGERQYYPLNRLQKIADLFEVEVTELLDDYHRFLLRGQGKMIKENRKRMGMTQYQFAQVYGVSVSLVKRWERNRIRVSKKMFMRINLKCTSKTVDFQE